MKNAIFIVFDDNYFNYAFNCLQSIKKNYPGHPEILVHYGGQNDEILAYLRTFKNLSLASVDERFLDLSGIDLGIVGSRQVYLRYILWTEGFNNYDTILHIDADTHVLKPLDHLFSTESFFAVNDFTPFGNSMFKQEFHDSPELKDILERWDLRMPIGEFEMLNAGVFVIPRKYRTKAQFDLLWAITLRCNSYTDFADQAAISLWCYINRIQFSDKIEFNFQTSFCSNPRVFFIEILKPEFSAADIAIVHFTWWKLNTIYYDRHREMNGFFTRLYSEYNFTTQTLIQ
jgi:lipopolysaccharide biosynthesis glycosyltransferase